MILKVFRVIWFFSLLAVLGSFMYVYASLPDPVVVFENPDQIHLSRESVFYTMLFLIASFNSLIYFFRQVNRGEKGEAFNTWFHGQVITLNLFFIVALSFISVFNSSERFDYSRIGVVIYSSIALVALWAISWPLYKIFFAQSKKAV